MKNKMLSQSVAEYPSIFLILHDCKKAIANDTATIPIPITIIKCPAANLFLPVPQSLVPPNSCASPRQLQIVHFY